MKAAGTQQGEQEPTAILKAIYRRKKKKKKLQTRVLMPPDSDRSS